MLDQQSEAIRLKNADELMYGNLDTNKLFPIDASTRTTHYAIYVERKKYNEEAGEMMTLKTTRRFLQTTIEGYERMLNEGAYWRRYKGVVVTVLHDPIKQAEMEGIDLKRGRVADASTISSRIASAKSASDFAKKAPAKKGDS